MTGSAVSAVDVVLGNLLLEWEEVRRRVAPGSGRAGGRRMTGSAVSAVDVGHGKLTFRMGGGPEEGGAAIWKNQRPADDGKRCFSGGRFMLEDILLEWEECRGGWRRGLAGWEAGG